MEHKNGQGYSTHLNSVVGIDNKYYIIPTMFGGKLYGPDQAIEIVKKNKMIDPDIEHPLPSFPTVKEALDREKILHNSIEQQVGIQLLLQDFLPKVKQ